MRTRREIIETLAQRAYEGRLLLFVGAGFSKCVVGSDKALSWLDLLWKVAGKLGVEDVVPYLGCTNPLDCPQVASNMIRRYHEKHPELSMSDCQRKVKRSVCLLCDWYPDKVQKEMWRPIFESIRPCAVITTNYDHVIEEILEKTAVTFSSDDTLPMSSAGETVVYHMHGVRTDPNRIVLTREDYLQALRPFSYRQSRLATLLRENSVLYLGYGKNDINLLSALDTAQETFVDVCETAGHSGNPEIHVQLEYDSSGGDDIVQEGQALSIKCADVFAFMKELADKCRTVVNRAQSFADNVMRTLMAWTTKESADKNGLTQRRANIINLFENNASLLNSQTRVGRHFRIRFGECIKAYYRRIRKDASKKGNWYRYADAWALLGAYFLSLTISSPWHNDSKNKISLYTRGFAYAIGWFNGIAFFLGKGTGKANRAYEWFVEDWTRIDPEVKDAIIDSAKRKGYKYILDLVKRAGFSIGLACGM